MRARRSPQTLTSQNVNDSFWHVEAGFTYRLLRVVSEFGIRGGVSAARASCRRDGLEPVRGGAQLRPAVVRLRRTDWLRVEGEFLTSITEVGFSLGGGGAVLLGDAYGSHLTLGFEGAYVFGTRGYSRLDLVVNRWLRVAPVVEVTDQPHASEPRASACCADFGISLGGGWLVTARGGYQARSFDSGGPAAGAAVAYSF